jgi:hypothetical protein
MATTSYMSGRKKYTRPQAMLWADNPGALVDGSYIPNGYEINSQVEEDPDSSLANQFMILSDHNRDAIDFSIERIENRERMINGRMRSYHIADKLSISTSWEMLPSRSFSENPNFDFEEGTSNLNTKGRRDAGEDGSFLELPNNTTFSEQYTTDGGAGGAELLEWYENHKGSFWVYLAYDKYTNFEEDKYLKLQSYNQVIEMFISDFSYSVVKRGGSNHDFWDISVSLEEV